MKKAFITGITGQDGSYLAELLLSKNYFVIGLIRRTSSLARTRIDHLRHNKNLKLIYGDMNDFSILLNVISKEKPDEIYNLAAQSHVKISFDLPFYTSDTDAKGFLNILEIVKILKLDTKIYQASTSEMYGRVLESPQIESTPFNPVSPYGFSKVYAHNAAKNYRESYNMFVCCGILFNHESPRRGENFISKKITLNISKYKLKKIHKFSLGNIYAKRDWGYAPEYVYGMWLMLQRDKPDDYILATNKTNTVLDFLIKSLNYLEIDFKTEGEGIDFKVISKEGNIIVDISKEYYRPSEVDFLQGDYTKAKNILNWHPKVDLDDLIKIMIDHDLENLRNEANSD